MEKIVEIRNITMNYHSAAGETQAVKDCSFDIKQGEFISLIGPSGCGNPPPTKRQPNYRWRLMAMIQAKLRS